MSMTGLRAFLFIIVCWTCTDTHAGSLFTFSNAPGQHGVGVRYVKQYDRSRAFPERGVLVRVFAGNENRGRPMQTVIWYPAQKGGQGVRYDDYLRLVGWETDF